MSKCYKNNRKLLRVKVFDKSISEGGVRVYFQLHGNINELGPSLLEENWRNCFPGNRRTGMDVRVRLWEEEGKRGYGKMETDEKKLP